jgi:hypothetical protein
MGPRFPSDMNRWPGHQRIDARMLLPHMWLRKLWLRHAWRGYPLYDPPRKVEERLLSKEEANENFEYFMRVRLQRVSYFRDWLLRYFGVTVTLDEKGIRALNRWGNKYAGLLLVVGPDGHPVADCYFSYDPPWTGKYTGYNIIFDMGITLGEAIIANCPKLRWDPDPVSAVLPHRARQLKRTSTGFQRAMLTGFDDLVSCRIPLEDAYSFARQMMRTMTTWRGINLYYSNPWGFRRPILEQFLNVFVGARRDYPAGDPYKLRGRMEPQEYAQFIDAQTDDEDDHDE